ncbi:MAG: hypothetical protein HY298_23930 [Verrucomicrobia bacterium]|nr:hypothetical protein [Verrucomicrobiota bacterium]
MGLLAKLFGRQECQPYVDAGTALTFKLPRSLNLPDWNDGLPNYTQEEIAAIDRRLSQFQQMANSELGSEAKFHPDAAPKLQRMLAGEALAGLARDKFMFQSEDIPTDWKPLASTFLKAWASRLDPSTLLELGDMLAKVGCKNEAKEVLQVVLLFPSYAKTLWGKNDDELLGRIVSEAKEALQTLN